MTLTDTLSVEPAKKKRRPRQKLPITVAKSHSLFAGETSYFVRIRTRPASSGGPHIPGSSFGVILPLTLALELRDALTRALDDDEVTTLPGADDPW